MTGGLKNREELSGEHREKGDEWKRSTRVKRKEVTGKEQLAKFGKVKEAHEEDAAEHTTLSVYVPTRHFTTAAAISVCVFAGRGLDD